MSPKEAHEIITDYSRSIKNLRPNAIVQSVFELPHSPGKIMYAHFLYAEYLVKENLLTNEIGDSLISSYAYLHSHFVENDDEVNLHYRNFLNGLNEGKIDHGFKLSEYSISPERTMEFNNFLADCQGRWQKKL